MRRPLAIAAPLAVVGALIGVPGNGPHAPAPPAAPPPFAVGFNESLAQTHRPGTTAAWQRLIDIDAGLHRKVGSTVLRTVLHWDATEPGRGRFDFATPDELVARYGAAGVRLLFVVDGIPAWASGDLSAWRAFIGAVAARYAGRIAGLDIFNEPNMPGTAIPPRTYARVLCAAHRAAAGRVRLGGGALATGPSLGPYLAAILRTGAGRCMEALSFHPYPTAADVGAPGSAFQRMFGTVRRLRDRYAPGLPLWVTETGWRAAAPSGEALQAHVLVAILRAVAAMRQRDVHLLLFHTLVGDPVAPGGAGYGVVELMPGDALRPRPAFAALARAIRG